MRLMFDVNGSVLPDQVQLRQFSCECSGCKLGTACIVDWERNAWKVVRLRLRADAMRNLEEEDDDEVFDNDA